MREMQKLGRLRGQPVHPHFCAREPFGSPWSLPGLLLPLRGWTPRKNQQRSWDKTGASRCSDPQLWGPAGALGILGGGMRCDTAQGPQNRLGAPLPLPCDPVQCQELS